jgi:hypothetical protein
VEAGYYDAGLGAPYSRYQQHYQQDEMRNAYSHPNNVNMCDKPQFTNRPPIPAIARQRQQQPLSQPHKTNYRGKTDNNAESKELDRSAKQMKAQQYAAELRTVG